MAGDRRADAMDRLRYAPILEACRNAPRTRRELAEATDVSRTTVYRMTVALADQEYVERTADGYRTTTRGEAFGRLAETFLEGIEAIDRLDPLFEVVSHPDLLDHAHTLTDPTVTTVDATDPYRVADRAIERFEAAHDPRGVVSSASPTGLLEDAREIVDTKDRIEWLFAERALAAHDAVGGEAFLDALEAPHLSIGVVPDEAVPFTFSVDRDDVSVSGHDPTSGLPTVIVESDSPAAWAWLDGRFRSLQKRATPLNAWVGR
ncbi:winged helix-turn-helix domain-containing protein [Saliphagus sp. LR7]|uniref:helix-turn-helix transcriptional regulator n=1 Tax=Saliphagus sp. LR7 TaxID=2282654 RepID=UPI000DF726B3|nr:helix-turn-helix domain-containing protein [Saliphagus sp. LR7]